MKRTRLRYGQLGGRLDAFIGGVHRAAIAMNNQSDLVAGCFSHQAEANKATGQAYGLEEDRIYSDYKEMLEKEAAREDKIDFVCICTPNRTHYEMAKACLEAGFHVACEKPLCFTSEEAAELKALAEEKNLLFAVTYTYTGYAMVKFARELIARGEIGEVINVNAEYLQDWLLDEVEPSGAEMSLDVWRMDPKSSGISNCVGDIGTHIEAAVTYMTGLKTKRVCAMLDKYGHELDLNANILVELENGSHGVFSSSQVAAGHYNGLVVRIFGSKGAIEWVQEKPDFLSVTPKGEPTRVYARGAAGADGQAAAWSRLPSGHPEGLTTAFANIYKAFQNAVLKAVNGEACTSEDLDFTDADYGMEGVKFIEACVASSENGAVWTDL